MHACPETDRPLRSRKLVIGCHKLIGRTIIPTEYPLTETKRTEI